MPEDTWAKRSQIQSNHDRGEQKHAHDKRDAEMHEQNGNQPGPTRLPLPNKKRIADFQKENCNAGDRKKVFETNENIGGNQVKWRTNQRTPKIDPVPPIASECFGQSAKKIDEAEMQLKNPPPKAEKLGIGKFLVPKMIERKPIR